jgi:transcriptional antiterminator RfaH
MSANCKWYVVQTHPNAEMRAAEHLRRQGFEVYIPRFRKLRRHARKTESVIRPLFPRYFFVAFDRTAGNWHAVRSTIGVSNLLGGEQGPTPLRDTVMQDLKQREDDAGFFRFEPRSRFIPGEKIRVLTGALSACIGLFESMTDRDRVTVLLELLGRKVRLVVDCENVARA